MAKMTVEFDTETKTFSAAVDGVAVPNAVGAEIYQTYDNEFRCAFMARSKDEGTGITEMRHLFASIDPRGKADASAEASPDFPGFVTVTDDLSPVQAGIAALFGATKDK